MRKDFINFAYMIFVTPYGKGYGCFAINKLSHNNFRIASSFCSTWDAHRFNKKRARMIASNRLKTEGSYIEVSLENDLKDDFRTLLYLVFKSKMNIPSWAIKSYDIEAYFLTLKDDKNSFLQMVDALDLNGSYFEHLYKAMYDNGLI